MRDACVLSICMMLLHLPWFYFDHLVGAIKSYEHQQKVKFSQEDYRYIMIEVIKAWDSLND